MDHFQKATANKHQYNQYNNPSLSAVNAVALANDIPWEDSYRMLLEQGKKYGLMLTDPVCVNNMLKEAGFVQRSHVKRMANYTSLNQYLLTEYPTVSHAIVLTVVGNASKKRYCAVRRFAGSEDEFVVLDIKEELRSVISLWLDYREINASKPIPDTPVMKTETALPSHQGFLYFQPNPLKNMIGDCVIRAYCAVFDRPWEEIMEMQAKSCEYNDTSLNNQFTYRSLTSEYEFDPYSRLTSDGRRLTGKEFCKHLDLMCRNGERIFAKVGSTHVVGIVPAEINGEKQYAIADSWDSSSRKIGDYWVFRPAKQKLKATLPDKKEKTQLSLNIGDHLIHPVFGKGVILESFPEDERLQIQFSEYGIKLLTCSWVRENCRQDYSG